MRGRGSPKSECSGRNNPRALFGDFVISPTDDVAHVDPGMVVECAVIIILLNLMEIDVEKFVAWNHPPPFQVWRGTVYSNHIVRPARSDVLFSPRRH